MFALNLAGIIPVSNFRSDMDLPYHTCLLPVATGLTAIENAVYTCLLSACKTVWIVCEDDTMPIIKDIIGEYVRYGDRVVPIFYAPCNPKDIGRRNSYAYSIIQGAKSATMATSAYSAWLNPNKFFVVFPMGVTSHEAVRSHAMSKKFKSAFESNLFFDQNGDSAMNNKMFPFAVTIDIVKECSFYVARTSTGRELTLKEGVSDDGLTDLEAMKRNYVEGRRIYDAKYFTISEVFAPVATHPSKTQDAEMFDISSWQGYKDYLNCGGERLISPNAKIKKATVEEIRHWDTNEEDINYAEEYERFI